MHGLWMWTITLFSFALFLRGEKPLRLKIRHLKLPSNYSGTILFFWFHLFYHLPKYLSKQLTSWIEYYCWSQKLGHKSFLGGHQKAQLDVRININSPCILPLYHLFSLLLKGSSRTLSWKFEAMPLALLLMTIRNAKLLAWLHMARPSQPG